MKPIPIKRIEDLSRLPHADVVGFVVSLNTRVFTTLAVLSAAHRLGIPLVIVECESTDGSYETLSQLMLPVPSWIVRERKRIHGVMIDQLMLALNSTRVLLIDSDIEVHDSKAFLEMQAAMNQDPFSYGASWTHGNHDMSQDGIPHGWFPRRPWIPFALFDRCRCAELIGKGSSFEATEIGNEFPVPVIARLLAMRWHVRWARGWEFRFLKMFRRNKCGVSAAFYVYDTGALLHETAGREGLRFGEIEHDLMHQSVSHYSGATRRTRSEAWTGFSDAERPILETLRKTYGIELHKP